ncbi:unnamed protein product [Chrysoparadoxa australica]
MPVHGRVGGGRRKPHGKHNVVGATEQPKADSDLVVIQSTFSGVETSSLAAAAQAAQAQAPVEDCWDGKEYPPAGAESQAEEEPEQQEAEAFSREEDEGISNREQEDGSGDFSCAQGGGLRSDDISVSGRGSVHGSSCSMNSVCGQSNGQMSENYPMSESNQERSQTEPNSCAERESQPGVVEAASAGPISIGLPRTDEGEQASQSSTVKGPRSAGGSAASSVRGGPGGGGASCGSPRSKLSLEGGSDGSSGVAEGLAEQAVPTAAPASAYEGPAARFAKGDDVEAMRGQSREYHPARVLAAFPDGTYVIVFSEGGSMESGVPEDQIRLRGETREEAPRAETPIEATADPAMDNQGSVSVKSSTEAAAASAAEEEEEDEHRDKQPVSDYEDDFDEDEEE